MTDKKVKKSIGNQITPYKLFDKGGRLWPQSLQI